MADRCGRCGLCAKYPEDHHEKKWRGTCLWFQHRIAEDEMYEPRECPEFFEWIPGVTPLQHFDYKLKRDNLGDAYQTAEKAEKRAVRSWKLARFSIFLSVLGIIFTAIKLWLDIASSGATP